jgi:hypothetical protein
MEGFGLAEEWVGGGDKDGETQEEGGEGAGVMGVFEI